MPKYIDADAFDESARQRFCAPCRDKKEDYHGVRCRVCWVGDMLDEVDNAPAADVAPVRRAEWDFDPLAGDWICSECYLHSMEHGRFCPNCGAKMDEEA